MDLQRICKSAFAWPWEDPRQAAQIEADVAARTMQAEANAKRRDRGLSEVSYVDPTAHTGRAITPEELEYKKKYTDWVVQQFEQGRSGGGIPSWQAFLQHKQNPSRDWSGAPHERHYLGVRKRDETPVWSPQIDKAIQQVNQNGGSVNFSENPSLYRKMDRETRSENAPGVLRPVSGRSPSGKMNYWWTPNINRNTAYPSTVDYRPDKSVEASIGTNKTASVCTYAEALMAKKAGQIRVNGQVWQPPAPAAPKGGGSMTVRGKTTTLVPGHLPPAPAPQRPQATQQTIRQMTAPNSAPATHYKMQPGSRGVTTKMLRQTTVR